VVALLLSAGNLRAYDFAGSSSDLQGSQPLSSRSELRVGTVDYSLSAEYWERAQSRKASSVIQPAPPDVIFILDQTNHSIASGFLNAACKAICHILYPDEEEVKSVGPLSIGNNSVSISEECRTPRRASPIRIAFIGFDSRLLFYNFNVRRFFHNLRLFAHVP
jgi:hypothetical protein